MRKLLITVSDTSMKYANLFLVEAPFQLISAAEASKSTTSGDNYLLIRVTGRLRNDQQLRALLNKVDSNWSRVYVINTTSNFRAFREVIRLKVQFIHEGISVNIIALGDFHSYFASLFCKLFSNYDLWFLDDGIAVLNLYRFGVLGIEVKPLEYQTQKVKRHLCRMGSLKTSKITLKTFLDLPPGGVFEVDQVDLFKAFISEKIACQTFDDELVFFLGAKLVEGGFLDHDAYFVMCKRVVERFDGKKIVYLPHRQEDQFSIDHLSRVFGFYVLRPDLPIEFYLCRQDVIPKHIVSVCSAALCTLPQIFRDMNVHIIDFDKHDLSDEDKDGFDVPYNYIELKGHARLIE